MNKRTAESIARKLAKRYGDGTFTVYEPGYHSSGWTVASEDAPYEWTYEASKYVREVAPKVYAEPVNHWCLGLYPA